ncbi:MAG: Gfo/Idh/MocA family oxidoreductase [Lentisphaeria bacterium]|jgi:predicted dehydrogenase|nr:Gfo/Idh/MocA family oxidoreductase [Lentisphaeria bacterium]
MQLKRRDFLRSAALTGAGAMLAPSLFGQEAAAKDEITVALVGIGNQGIKLLEYAFRIPGVRFVAVCDIWEQQNLRRGKNWLKARDHEVNAYVDYREMLEKEKDLDAVLVATPDFWHAEQAVACLAAGKHVYCEKEMAQTLENCRLMVEAGRKSDRMFQIGHQRRSNPIYQLALKAIQEVGLCGQVTNCYGQWNRGVQEYVALSEQRRARLEIPADVLAKFGYENMEQFLNWRWFKKYSAGPIADLGSHQIDIFSWFLGANPSKVLALGSTSYFQREWYEDVSCMYEYATKVGGKAGSARAYYQILNTNSYGDYFERFSGDGGALTLSETPDRCFFVPERGKELPEWLAQAPTMKLWARNTDQGLVGTDAYRLVDAFRNWGDEGAQGIKAIEDCEWGLHQLHLANFFDAIRANDKKRLTCPPEEAYATAMAVLSVIPAIEKGGMLTFKPEDFEA